MLDNVTSLMSWTNTPAVTSLYYNITPLISWSNTPVSHPLPEIGLNMNINNHLIIFIRRLTPTQPTPRGTPLLSRRASPRVTPRSTPRANNTPRATPTPLTPTFQRRNYDLRLGLFLKNMTYLLF